MKLILKRMERAERTYVAGEEFFQGGARLPEPFALHTEDGQMLPCQVSTSMNSDGGAPVKLTVTFIVDGDKVKVEGDA